MVFDEVNKVGSFNFSERYNFCPLGEVIDYCENKPMTASRWRTDRSYDIDSPSFKWPWSNCGVEQLRGLVYEIRINLTSLTPSCILHCVSNHCQPIVTKSVQSVLELWNRLMGTVYAIMSFFDYFSCFHVRQIMEKYAIVWMAMEYLYHWNIVKVSRSSPNRSCLLGIIR